MGFLDKEEEGCMLLKISGSGVRQIFILNPVCLLLLSFQALDKSLQSFGQQDFSSIK